MFYFVVMKQLSMDQFNRPDAQAYKASEKMPVVVVLDNIRSGLNVGAIFRTADAFLVEAVYLCGITVQPPHAEILKTALGATDSVHWQYFTSTFEAIADLKGKNYHLLPVEQTDNSITLDNFSFEEISPVALIFGNEMRGISADVLSLCDASLEIPQSGIKHSLNVATSAGIVVWECYRQFLRRRFLSS
jgi:tRNA G18 (ribose-2'-O)-methylase SpoU